MLETGRVRTAAWASPPGCLSLPHRAATLRELEQHFVLFRAGYSPGALANLLTLYVSHGLQLGHEAAAVAAAHALDLLRQQQARWEEAQWEAARGMPQPCGSSAAAVQVLTLGQLSKLAHAVAVLQLDSPPLVAALLPALGGALAAEDEAAEAGCSPPAGMLVRHLVRSAAALGRLQAEGLLAAAGLDSVEAVAPLWRASMRLLDYAAARATEASGGGAGLSAQDARACLAAAAALNRGLGGFGRGDPFWVCRAVQAMT